MASKTVALEEGLTSYQQGLESAGFSTVIIRNVDKDTKWQQADLLVLNGMDENLMGIQSTKTKIPVIAANGQTVDELVEIARERLM